MIERITRRRNRTCIGRQVTCAVDELAIVCGVIKRLVDILCAIGLAGKGTAFEITAHVLRAYIIVGYGAIPVAVEIVDERIAASGHTLLATFVPPAETVGDVIRPVSRFVGTAGTYEIGETVVICSAGTARFGRLQITETTPRNGDIVRLTLDIKVSVHTVLEIAVVDPYILGAIE